MLVLIAIMHVYMYMVYIDRIGTLLEEAVCFVSSIHYICYSDLFTLHIV